MEIIIIFCGILLVISIILLLFAKLMEKLEQKAMEPINNQRKEYKEKLRMWCEENGVVFKEPSLSSPEIRVNQIPGYLWFSDKDIVFCPDAINCGGEALDIKGRALLIKYDKIKYFTKDGSISYTNEIVNKGKNISVSGAIIGGVIAGEAGAIIGSRKDMGKIENVTVKHDDVYTYVYFEQNEKIKLAEIKGAEFYQIILRLMPEKEYNYILSEKEKNC